MQWKLTSTSLINFLILTTVFEPFMPLKKHFTLPQLLPHKPGGALHKCHLHSSLISHKIYRSFVALKTDYSFLRRDAETHTSYQSHNFSITSVKAIKSYLTQLETRTDVSLLRSSHMDPFKSRDKMFPGTSQPYFAHRLKSNKILTLS
jgi:hypothetical protein